MVKVEFKKKDIFVNSAFRDHLVIPFACPQCGYIEFYAQIDKE